MQFIYRQNNLELGLELEMILSEYSTKFKTKRGH